MSPPRYVVFGAGAVGGTIAGLLALAGHRVTVIARGAHGDAIAKRGLLLVRPDAEHLVELDAVAHPSEVGWDPTDVVILSTKSQDTASALDDLAACAPSEVAVVCAQNGVENERIALRRFERVHGMCVMLPAEHLEPGLVVSYGAPAAGILDVGRVPSGTDAVDRVLARDLESAGCSSNPDPSILRWKYAKLRLNLGNAIEAACGRAARGSGIGAEARDEADACFAAAGIEVASVEEDRSRRGDVMRIVPVRGHERDGGSTWQSLARASAVETAYLNGEVVLLGRLHDVPTPVNLALTRVVARMVAEGAPPGSLTEADVRAEISSASSVSSVS